MNSATVRDKTSDWVDLHNKKQTENTPLITMSMHNNQPPVAAAPTLATSEIDDLDDDVEISNKPYPGIDDGFFATAVPTAPPTTQPAVPTPGGGSDWEAPKLPHPDDVDGRYAPRHPPPPSSSAPVPQFPYAPGYGPHEFENGLIPDLESIPDLNQYQHRKTLAQGMMDLALFSANANQLRYVLESYERHPYYYPSLILISFSILLQIAIGLGLILNSRYNVKNEKEICIANKINNYTVIGIFLVTAVNVFVSAFGVANIQTITPPIQPAVQPAGLRTPVTP